MKRFYRAATSGPAEGGFAVMLDGRSLRTPNTTPLVVPTAALAAAIAAEWEVQQGDVRPATMPLFRLAATALDRTAASRERIIGEVAGYAGTDLVCHRADRPPSLAQRQQEVWQPLVDWARQRYDAGLTVTCGVIPAGQSPATQKAFAAVVAALDDFRLTALHALTGACGSLVLALAVLEGRLGADEAYAASQLDETFQIEAWGEDAEAAVRRHALAADIAAAAGFLALLAV